MANLNRTEERYIYNTGESTLMCGLLGNDTQEGGMKADLTMSMTLFGHLFGSGILDDLSVDREIKSVTDKYQIVVLST